MKSVRLRETCFDNSPDYPYSRPYYWHTIGAGIKTFSIQSRATDSPDHELSAIWVESPCTCSDTKRGPYVPFVCAGARPSTTGELSVSVHIRPE